MINVIEEQIQSFIENHLFNFYELNSYFRRLRSRDEEDAFEFYKKDVEDIDSLKDEVFNRIMILEPSSKSIFLRKFIDKISEYNDNDIYGLLSIALLDKKGVKPKFENPLDGIGFSMLNDYYKLPYYDLKNLDFNFDELSNKLFNPFLERHKKFLDFLLDYSKDFTYEIQNSTINKKKFISNRVFIVHGHNDGIKYEVAQTLNKLGLTPIILHEQVSENKTIIEKIENYSDVKYAIVILSDDDHGNSKNSTELNPRARQNVVFEMGYFMGILGRKNVCCIVNNNKLEKPSDINGIVYLNYNGNWVLDLTKELDNVGFELEMNNLLK